MGPVTDQHSTPVFLAGAGLALLALGVAASSAQALDPNTKDPRKIAEAAEEQNYAGDKQVGRLIMTLTDSAGRKRERVLQVRSLDFDGGVKTLMLFESPADVRNTGLLSINYDDSNKDDDQWLYLPSLHRSTRISSADRSGAFMGTDISYADLTKKDVDAYDYEMLEVSTKVDGEECWLIEARPRTNKEKKETGYVKSHMWVSKKHLLPVQVKIWVEKGRKLKYVKATDIRKVDGVWFAFTTTLRTLKNEKVESTTVMKFTSVKFGDPSVQDSDFTQRRLEKGI